MTTAPAIRLSRNIELPERPIVVNSAEAIHEFMKPWLEPERYENFWLIPLLKENWVVNGSAPILIATGERGSVLTNIPDICKAALLADCDAVVCVHNHPPGYDVDPSEGDLQSTEVVILALATVGVQLLDHVIMTPKLFHSINKSHPEMWTTDTIAERMAVAYNMVSNTSDFRRKLREWRRKNREEMLQRYDLKDPRGILRALRREMEEGL